MLQEGLEPILILPTGDENRMTSRSMKFALMIPLAAVAITQILPLSEAEAKRRRRSREPKATLDQSTYDFSFARQQASCKLGENTLDFMIRGKTFKVSPEEESLGSPYVFAKTQSKVQLVTKSGKVAVEDGQYKLWPDQSPDSLCTGTLGFMLGGNTLGVAWLDNRNPLVKNMTVVAINTDKNELIGSFVSVGPVGNVELSSTGLYVEVGATEKAAENTDFSALKVWKKVSLSKKHLVVENDLEKTWAKSSWKDQFKTSDDFAKAAGWSEKNKKFKNGLVYTASGAAENQTAPCIQFSEKPLKSNPCKP